jgi:hypothetical protein
LILPLVVLFNVEVLFTPVTICNRRFYFPFVKHKPAARFLPRRCGTVQG